MSKTYILLTIIAIAGAVVLLLLPEKNKQNELDPELLLQEIINPSRYLSVDNVAHRIIGKDPSILLVDVRSSDHFNQYTLPGSLNIPLNQLLDAGNEDYLNRSDMDVVLYSNSDLHADQAWILCTRLGYKNLYVMEGGLNNWFETIMKPKLPAPAAPSEDFDLYSFRLAASQYFGGNAQAEISTGLPQENIVVKKREKKSVTAGGC